MKNSWPPRKAWTSEKAISGYRYYVAINYGGKSDYRWAQLVSVLDGRISLKVSWKELQDETKWKSGWAQIERSHWNARRDQHIQQEVSIDKNKYCLHPSEDSGLMIPIKSDNVRKW